MPKIIIVIAMITLTGCNLYRLDVQQGNVIEDEKVAQMKVGMDRGEVLDLLGTPLVADPFHPERWDYVYLFKPAYGKAQRSRVTVFFDANDKLARWERQH